MRLSDRISGKDNNLNLVRFVAAFAVLVSHSFVLSTGRLDQEPLRAFLGMSLGEIAVDIFFAASGFLVARSLVQRGSGFEFVWSRLLRIYPGLLAMLAGCVFVLAPLLGDLGLREFFTHRGTLHFLVQNIVLLRGVELTLPGLFWGVPWSGIVNGSLWTLTYELRLYLSLVVIWWILKPAKAFRPTLFRASCVVIAMVALGWYAATLFGAEKDVNNLVDPTSRLVLMFYSGVVWWIASAWVRLDWRWLVASAGIVALARIFEHWNLFHVLFSLWIPYALWWVAFVPGGWIRGFNKYGDASYGIYIYAFPLQQVWIHLLPGTGPWAMILGAGVPTVVLAYVSWHLLEAPCLEAKGLPRKLLSRWPRRGSLE